jgi:hypothetical protein
MRTRALPAFDLLASRVVTVTFDRERLVTGRYGGPPTLASVAEHPEKTSCQHKRRSTMAATLKLTHRAIGVEVRRGTYDVVLDGERGRSLELNDPIEIQVEPGRHTLQVRNGRNSSRTKTFDAAEGETVAFRCSGKSILPIFLLSFVVPSLALSLHRE